MEITPALQAEAGNDKMGGDMNIEIKKNKNDIFREWIIGEWKSHNEVDPIYQLQIIDPSELTFSRNEHNYQIILDQKMVGFVAIKIFKKEIYLYRLFIDENYRNLGIGTFVMNWLVELAKKKKKDISLEVYGNNKAINLYEKFNFKTQYQHMVLKITSE